MALDFRPLSGLEAALAAIAPAGVALACTDPSAPEPEDALFVAEAAAMARAVSKRRAEFAAGRLAAHRAMERLGLLPAPVPMGRDRAPRWPEGLVGSISHCEGACAALVGRAAEWRALAIDLEPDEDLPADLVTTICLPGERAWIATLPEAERGRAARLVFAAKECAYKLQYPLTGRMLDFGEVEIALQPRSGRFQASFAGGIGAILPQSVTRGRFGRSFGFVHCVMSALQ